METICERETLDLDGPITIPCNDPIEDMYAAQHEARQARLDLVVQGVWVEETTVDLQVGA